ncbi:oxidoreductase [Terriglobus aquaticus]|uniref:Oxidoreductase n=1 Tax=Terriglobus aquaticus TaxID=940139 RepID=A0ABW9KP48_9BACT|nr:oxidoreductase [Terriglobus aquaticus]
MAEQESPTGKGKVWFITGCSTGFGRLLAEAALERGDRVVATARDESKIIDLTDKYPQTALALTVDVTDKNTILIAVQDAMETFGQIDVLVNNAGYGLSGAVEEASDEEIEQVIATNVFGVVDTTRAVLPHMRERRSGHILMLSSVAGLIGTQGLAYYNLTKFAVEGFSEGLAQEVKHLGIRVSIIEPGPFRTDFLGRSGQVAQQQIDDYKESAGKLREYFNTQAGQQKGDPAKAVEAMLQLADTPEPPLHLLLGRNAYDRQLAKLDEWKQGIEAWREVTLGADFPEAKTPIQ